MARTKNTCPIPLFVSLCRNLKNDKNMTPCHIPLLDSLWGNFKNGKNKDVISDTSLRFSFEEP